ncbi:MAG: hypothetical protein ACI8QZ_002329 [Chlamydiales bacterium]|jgi:hypothetical protein
MGRAHDEMESIAAEYIQLAESAETTRPVLRGEPIDGFAHDEYAALYAPAAQPDGTESVTRVWKSALFEDWQAYLQVLKNAPAEAAALRGELVHSHAWIFETLARGARCTDARWKANWDDVNGTTPKLAPTRAVVEIATLGVAEFLDQSLEDRAVDVWLDLVQYGGDLTHAPGVIGRMIGADVIHQVLGKALFDDGVLDRLPAPQLERLAQGLRTLESGLPKIRGARNWDLAAWAHTIAREYPNAEFVSLAPATLGDYVRFAFTGRHEGLDRVRQLSHWTALENAFADDSWTAWIDGARAYREHVAPSEDPTGVGESIETTQHMMRVDLRIARAAIEYRLSGQAVALPDPFGGSLEFTVEQARVRVASRGPRGGSAGMRIQRNFALNGDG